MVESLRLLKVMFKFAVIMLDALGLLASIQLYQKSLLTKARTNF